MDDIETTNPVEGEALPSAEVINDEQDGSSADPFGEFPDDDGEDGSADANPEDTFEEIERDGKRVKIPVWLKPELMMQADYTTLAQYDDLSCCRFRGHRDKVFLEPEGVDATTEVQPRVQA